MDGNRFDALARSLHSRRTFMQTLAALGAGVGIAGGDDAAARKKKKKKRDGARFGCTKHDNSCSVKSDGDVACPDAPSNSGAFCVKNNKGRSVCTNETECFACKRKADCVAEFGPGAKCIKKCPFCQLIAGVKSLCYVPFTAPPV
ncbi:MAG TPA: hypothetical protein VFI22_05295 [Thermomicrobiales bacterium]|nr:hypothetical protein [Thermomicrobiales bacterium]